MGVMGTKVRRLFWREATGETQQRYVVSIKDQEHEARRWECHGLEMPP